ncbi:hypothetical protein [Tepidibacter sp. Z1-5]|uniref:hypothetical protein n=1 Tax=Tepidibacter sp. Z1-5 TaxID=3134138 RepID=UPI0030C10D07
MNILYFSPILWNDLKQRPQHIAEELSYEHKVYYIEPSISFINSVINKNNLYKYNKFNVNKNLEVIRPSGKYRLPKSLEIFDVLGINSSYEKIQLKKLIQKCDIIWLGSPIYYSLFKGDKDKKIVYDKMDDYVTLTNNKLLKKIIVKNEDELIKKASIIFTTCNIFFQHIKNKNKNKHVFVVNNGVPIDFEKTIENANNEIVSDINKMKQNEKVIFGYIGTIDHWFDYEAIKRIINHDERFHVVLVGKNNINELEHNRIHYYAPVSKNELPKIINVFDYCLYTFKINEFLDTIDPVKIYEYLSLNKKVIGCKSIEIEKFKNYMTLYINYDSLIQILKEHEFIKNPFNSDDEIKDFIQRNSWKSRIHFINEKLRKKY